MVRERRRRGAGRVAPAHDAGKARRVRWSGPRSTMAPSTHGTGRSTPAMWRPWRRPRHGTARRVAPRGRPGYQARMRGGDRSPGGPAVSLRRTEEAAGQSRQPW